MAVKIVCDFCDRPLEFDGERFTMYKTKKVNTLALFPHLCKSCADKLDDILAEAKTRLMAQEETSDKVLALYSELNQARRERLGTKG